MSKQEDDKSLAVADTIEINGTKFSDQDVRKLIVQAKEAIDQSFREVAKLIYVVYERSLFTRWGFKNFEEYVNADLGFGYRKANYLVKIWDWYTKNVTRQDVLDAIWNEIGWSKARELVGIITDENADEWLERARELNAIELQEAARKYLKAKEGGDGGGGGGNDDPATKSMTFKLAEPQKENVEEALKLSASMSGSEKKGHNLDLICTNFQAMNAQSVASDSLDFLKTIEKQYGISLLAVRTSDNTVIHGREIYEAVLDDARKEAGTPAETPSGDDSEESGT